jgi:hypothetical protein
MPSFDGTDIDNSQAYIKAPTIQWDAVTLMMDCTNIHWQFEFDTMDRGIRTQWPTLSQSSSTTKKGREVERKVIRSSTPTPRLKRHKKQNG